MKNLLNYFGYYKLNKGIKLYTTKKHQMMYKLPDGSCDEMLKNVWRTTKSDKTTHEAVLLEVKEL